MTTLVVPLAPLALPAFLLWRAWVQRRQLVVALGWLMLAAAFCVAIVHPPEMRPVDWVMVPAALILPFVLGGLIYKK